jgi:hypothetical protein
MVKHPKEETRKPYNGSKRSLVIALDVGTTVRVSLAHLFFLDLMRVFAGVDSLAVYHMHSWSQERSPR